MPSFRAFVVLFLAAGIALGDEPKAEGVDGFLKGLKFRPIGPSWGGRACRVCGVPGDPLTYYAATAMSGVWKSSDGGLNWKPIFDDQPCASAGSIAVAPSDPNVVYVGAGEANIRGNVLRGDGIYKSTDAGKTWSHVWKQAGQIGTIVVHPTNADIAYAAVLGSPFAPNRERGVFRTVDGGKNWKQVLFKDPEAGASDIAMNPNNPRILFAGIWETRRRPWTLTSGGPSSGLYVSRDAGDTWKRLEGNGLPKGPLGRIGVAVAPSDGARVYALIEANEGGLFRSDDGGENWKRTSDDRLLRQRAWYYTTLTVDPSNPDVVWAPNVPLLKSIDGGKTFAKVGGTHHGDHHDVWIDPKNPKRMIEANDGGVDVSTDGGGSWYAPRLPWGQFYRINVDSRKPYHVTGTLQDIGAGGGPSDTLASGGINVNDWYNIGGGETGYTASDPKDPNIVYAGEYDGILTRYDHRTGLARHIGAYPFNSSGHGAEDKQYRFRWPAPMMISPHDPKAVFHAGNALFRTTDGGQSWTKLSPDLTRDDKSKQRWSGGPITGDNTGAEHFCTLSAIAESPLKKGVLWTGSDDGLVQVSQDDGKTWKNVTAAIEGLPEWGTVQHIEPSRRGPGAA
ncbi:MAG TPA: glycosyl hydrolase, partial [Planctomycetia bacterium]|nr:glycosyl hydrolase [Planctomycetia bacterium]